MIFQDVWFAKLLSRKGWANRLVDLVAVAALTFIEVDQLEVAGCGDFGVSAESLIHDDDSWWLLMVPDVAFPGPKDIGSQCCLVYPIEVPTTFPDYLSTGSSFFWSDGKICRRPLCFMVKSIVSGCFRWFLSTPIHWSTGNSFHRNIRVCFFSRWFRWIVASLGCRRDWINAVVCVMMF